MDITCKLLDQGNNTEPEDILTVRNDGVFHQLVVVEIEGKTRVVCGSELIKAVENCLNNI